MRQLPDEICPSSAEIAEHSHDPFWLFQHSFSCTLFTALRLITLPGFLALGAAAILILAIFIALSRTREQAARRARAARNERAKRLTKPELERTFAAWSALIVEADRLIDHAWDNGDLRQVFPRSLLPCRGYRPFRLQSSERELVFTPVVVLPEVVELHFQHPDSEGRHHYYRLTRKPRQRGLDVSRLS